MIPRHPLEEYLAKRIDQNADGHWYWLGAVQNPSRGGRGGYGLVQHWSLRNAFAHRVMYEQHVGPIPEGYQIDHLCRVRLCCNPDHLEAVTQAENIRRQPNVIDQMARTHCPQGHEYVGENLRMRPKGRGCRACDLASANRAWARLKSDPAAMEEHLAKRATREGRSRKVAS